VNETKIREEGKNGKKPLVPSIYATYRNKKMSDRGQSEITVMISTAGGESKGGGRRKGFS